MKATTVNQEKNKDIIFIEKIDMSEYKNPKTVMKYKERKKRSKLFSHFFHNSTFKEVIKNKKAGKYI